MSLKERLQEDWKVSMKNRDAFKTSVLSMAKAAVLQAEKVNGLSIDDDAVISVLSKEIKQRREAIAEFERGNRQDLVQQNEKEIEILLQYLPQQLTEQEIAELIKSAVNEIQATSIKDMGKVMAIVNPKVKGKADGKLVSQIVKDFLA